MPETAAPPESQTATSPKHWTTWPLRLALVVWWLGMFTGTHLPSQPSLQPPPIPDKLAHFVAFFGIGFLLATWHGWRAPISWNRAAGCFLVLAVYAVVDELTQIPVGRQAEWLDGVADLCGGALGILLAKWIARTPSVRPIPPA